MSTWASDLVTDAIFERDWAPVVSSLLLFELPHDMLPSRVLVEVVRLLRLNNMAQLTLLNLTKVTLLLVELVNKEPFVGRVVHVF